MIMTKFCLIASLLFITSIGQAQTDKNDIVINVGVSSGYGYPSSLYRENSGIPVINLSGDYSLTRLVSVGVYTAYTYTFYKFEYPDMPETEYKDVWKGWDVGIKSTFHVSPFLMKNEDWDLYIAAFFGYANHSLVFDRKHVDNGHINYHVGEINAVAGRPGPARLPGWHRRAAGTGAANGRRPALGELESGTQP